MTELGELLKQLKKDLKKTKNSKCKRCGKPTDKQHCDECLAEKKAYAARQKKGKIVQGNGYKYVYDDNGKPVMAARKIMSEHLGRPLTKEETVGYRDGDRQNIEVENLYLSLRSGVPLDRLVCKECGAHGKIEIK